MVGRDDAAAGVRHPFQAVTERGCDPCDEGRHKVPGIGPERLGILVPELRDPQARQEHEGEFSATVEAKWSSDSRAAGGPSEPAAPARRLAPGLSQERLFHIWRS